MAEQLAELRQKGGNGIESNLFYTLINLGSASTSWTTNSYNGTVNDPNDSAMGTQLCPKFAHLSSGTIVVDQDIPKAYLSASANRGRTTNGTAVYTGIQLLKNGTVISGSSIMGNSSTASPTYRRLQTSFAKGDVLTVQVKATATGSTGFVTMNIVTDD